MDASFSSRAQTLISSISLSSSSSSSHFLLPASVRRELLGSPPRPPGLLRSRRSRRRPPSEVQTPRCLFNDGLYVDPVLVVAATVAAFLAIQEVVLNRRRRRRDDPTFSDHEASDIFVSAACCNQQTRAIREEHVESHSLCTKSRAKVLTEEIKDTIGDNGNRFHEQIYVTDTENVGTLKFQTRSLVCEEMFISKISKVSGDKHILFSSELTEAEGLTSSSVLVNEGKTELCNFTADVSNTLSGEQKEADPVFNMPTVFTEPIFSSIIIKDEKSESNEDTDLEISTLGIGELLVLSYKGRNRPFDNEVNVRDEGIQLTLRSITGFNSICTEPTHANLQLGCGSYFQLRPAMNREDFIAKHPLLTAGDAERHVPIACLREGSANKQKELFRAHGFTTDIKKSPMHRNDSTNFPGGHRPNGSFIKDSHDTPAYLRTYTRFLRDKRLNACIELLERMERKGLLDMDKIYHAKFVEVCKSQKAVEEAFRFVRLIRRPTLSTFNMLLSVCAHSQNFEGAFQVMLLVKEAGFNPDCKLYTTLISTCAKSGKVDAMFEVFHEMVNAGVEPSVNTYGALIDGCARAGQVAKAFGAYGIMRSKKVQPDRVIFNALITACGHSGAVDRAFDVLAEMMAEPKPLEPDHVTVGALMKTCIHAGQADRAREVYKMLHTYNIKGTSDVYTIAVSSCSQTGDLEFAVSIYDDMTSKGVVPDEMFLSTLVDVAGHAGKVDAAFEILENAKNKGIKLGNVSYSSLMGACCNARNWQKGLELFEDIKTMKLLPTVSTLNALVKALCDGDQLLKSVEVLHEMKEAGVQPNIITYSILLAACEKKHEGELGFMLLPEAKEDGILPNLVMCRCLTGLCLWSFEKACSLGEPIVSFDSGKPQIDNTWTSRAIMAYRETISAGVIPTIEVFSQVLGCLKFPRDTSLRERMVENLWIPIDASRNLNICSLLDGFGEYDTRSFSVLEEAASLGVVPRVSYKDSPIIVDARKLQIHTVEVYILTILKGLKHRLAAGVRLPNITILLPIEKTRIESANGERTVNLAGRVGQAVGSLLRRLGLDYHGNESYGKIRINGLTLRRWFKPKLYGPSLAGRPSHMSPLEARLAKGITNQQRNIRSLNNLSVE